MSAILNQIKSIVEQGVQVEMSNQLQYGKFPVLVKDKTDSITSGWELLYRIGQSKYNGKAYDPYGHFSEIRMKNFGNLYTIIQQVYSQFKQGVNVGQAYDTNFATYQPNEGLWFTALQEKNGTSITMTITDDKSPFHMLSLNFFITMSKQNGQPYMIGFDACYDQQNDVYTEKFNASMLPRSKRYVPVYKQDNGASTIKAGGTINQQGLVEINEQQTEVVYLQKAGNERKLLAGIYEKLIIELVLDKVSNALQSNQAMMQPNAGQQNPATPNTPFGNPNGMGGSQLGHTNNSFGWTGQSNQQTQSQAFPQGNSVFNPGLTTDTSGVF